MGKVFHVFYATYLFFIVQRSQTQGQIQDFGKEVSR